MANRFFIRTPVGTPGFAQSKVTYLYFGRWVHICSLEYRMWFVVNPAPPDPLALNRCDTEMREITYEEMRVACGPRLDLEIREDHFGFRLKHIALILRKIPLLRRLKWVKRYASLDEEDDPRWWCEREPPRIGMTIGKENIE